jgi:hypothetical protein
MTANSATWRFAPLLAFVAGFGSCAESSHISDGLVSSYRGCPDGWPSPSIGTQGACSNHSGVVTRTVDRRTDEQRYVCYGLNTMGILCLLMTPVLLSGPLRSSGPRVQCIRIEGDAATVPLIIAGESRLVNVVRLNDGSYVTCEPVAHVKCPDGKRSSIYASTIKFKGNDGEYRQDLSTWIYTGRGRSGGYVAHAFAWRVATATSTIPPAQT